MPLVPAATVTAVVNLIRERLLMCIIILNAIAAAMHSNVKIGFHIRLWNDGNFFFDFEFLNGVNNLNHDLSFRWLFYKVARYYLC